MGREKDAAIEIEEMMPNIAIQSGALRECEIHSENHLRSFDEDAEKEACDLAAQHFHTSLGDAEARRQMIEFLEESPEDCMSCENLMRS